MAAWWRVAIRSARYVASSLTKPSRADPHHARNLNPGVVGAVAGRPHHHPNVLQGAVVGEPDGAPCGVDQPGSEPDSGPLELAPVGADDELPLACPPAEPGIDGHAH